MPIKSRDVARLSLVFIALVACVLVCVNCVLPRRRTDSVHALATPAIPRCDSGELLLSQSAVNAAQVVGREEYSRRWADARQGHAQDDALALRVELARQSFEPGEPISLRVVISNQAGRALTFLRPTRVAARPMAFADLVLEVVNSSGERMA